MPVDVRSSELVAEPAAPAGARGPRPRSAGLIPRVGLAATSVVIPLALLIAWQLIATLFVESIGPFFPPPAEVAETWYDWLTGATGAAGIYSGKMLSAILASAQRIVIAYALAVASGVLLGVLVGWSSITRRMVDPALQFLRPIPVTAWVPISILWFGIGNRAAIFLVFLASFFPVFLNTTQGVRYVDRPIIRAGQMLGARGARLLRYVVLPASLPSIFVGLRVGLGFAWMAVVVSELVAVKNGLGYVMFDAYGFLRADIVLASMGTIGALGFLTDRLMLVVERKSLRWAQ